MANENFTQLPSVTNALSSDIIAAVQGGVTVQETLGQVLNLNLANVILNYAGNPNLAVAGQTYQLLWDSSDNFLWICTQSGSTSTAVWKPIVGALTNGQLVIGSTGNVPSQATLTAGTGITILNAAGSITISTSGSGVSWNVVTGASATMASNNGYIANKSTLVSLALPATSSVGDVIYVVGQGSGGWSITQASGQLIHIGSSVSTTGAGGSVSSSNQYDSVKLVCITLNTEWTTVGGVQGNLTVV